MCLKNTSFQQPTVFFHFPVSLALVARFASPPTFFRSVTDHNRSFPSVSSHAAPSQWRVCCSIFHLAVLPTSTSHRCATLPRQVGAALPCEPWLLSTARYCCSPPLLHRYLQPTPLHHPSINTWVQSPLRSSPSINTWVQSPLCSYALCRLSPTGQLSVWVVALSALLCAHHGSIRMLGKVREPPMRCWGSRWSRPKGHAPPLCSQATHTWGKRSCCLPKFVT
jgi:hypothetical protein